MVCNSIKIFVVYSQYIKHYFHEYLQHKERTRLIGKFPPIRKQPKDEGKDELKSDIDEPYENPSNSHSRTFRLKEEQVFLSIDYISNIPTLECENPKDAFYSPNGVTYFEIYQVHIENGKRVRTSFPYIHDAKFKGWGAITYILEKHLQLQQNKLNTLLKSN